MTYRRTRTGSLKDIVKSAKKFVERHTHEVPTGPHTDVTRRKINPSLRNPDMESGRMKEANNLIANLSLLYSQPSLTG